MSGGHADACLKYLSELGEAITVLEEYHREVQEEMRKGAEEPAESANRSAYSTFYPYTEIDVGVRPSTSGMSCGKAAIILSAYYRRLRAFWEEMIDRSSRMGADWASAIQSDELEEYDLGARTWPALYPPGIPTVRSKPRSRISKRGFRSSKGVGTLSVRASDACLNDTDVISGDPWDDRRAAEDVVTVIPADSPGRKGYCIRRQDLIRSMGSTMVYRWLPFKATEPQYGRPDLDRPFYKFPFTGVWLTPDSMSVLANPEAMGRPDRWSVFLLKRIGLELLGSQFGVSSIHGSREPIYRLIPIQSERDVELRAGGIDIGPARFRPRTTYDPSSSVAVLSPLHYRKCRGSRSATVAGRRSPRALRGKSHR
jgi:hypothetical protein